MIRGQFLLFFFLSSAFLFVSNKVSALETDYQWYLPIVSRPAPTIKNIEEPLLIYGEIGRIYAYAEVDGVPHTVALSTIDGLLLISFPYAGKLGLDRLHQKIVIDQGKAGVIIVDVSSGEELGHILLPNLNHPAAVPQIDPYRQIAYVFRENVVYILDFVDMRILDTRMIDIPRLVCGKPQGAAPITRSFYDSFYDLISKTLYISLNTWVCTGFMTDRIRIYDPIEWNLWGEYDTPSQYQASAFAGNLFGIS